jgi:hypothetical protein
MNFKTLILFAGAVALASASSPVGDEDSNKLAQSQDEEESNKMAETACHPGPSRCAACLSAGAKRVARQRAIVGWRNTYNAANVRNYRAWLAQRAKYLKYYGQTYYYAHLAVLRRQQAYVNQRVAATIRQTDYLYANCK